MARGHGPVKECEWKQGVSGGLEHTEDVDVRLPLVGDVRMAVATTRKTVFEKGR
jgi:hypothetical protein